MAQAHLREGGQRVLREWWGQGAVRYWMKTFSVINPNGNQNTGAYDYYAYSPTMPHPQLYCILLKNS